MSIARACYGIIVDKAALESRIQAVGISDCVIICKIFFLTEVSVSCVILIYIHRKALARRSGIALAVEHILSDG